MFESCHLFIKIQTKTAKEIDGSFVCREWKKNLHWSKTLNSEIQIFRNIVAEQKQRNWRRVGKAAYQRDQLDTPILNTEQ